MCVYLYIYIHMFTYAYICLHSFHPLHLWKLNENQLEIGGLQAYWRCCRRQRTLASLLNRQRLLSGAESH